MDNWEWVYYNDLREWQLENSEKDGPAIAGAIVTDAGRYFIVPVDPAMEKFETSLLSEAKEKVLMVYYGSIASSARFTLPRGGS